MITSFIDRLEIDTVHRELLDLFYKITELSWSKEFQYGVRKGERKGAHLLTTALTAHFFYKILTNKYDEIEDRLISLSALIHDMDKIYDVRLKEAVTYQNVTNVIKNIGAEKFLDSKYIGDIITLIAGHHKKTMLLSLEETQISPRRLQKMENLIKAADIMTLHHSPYDAFHDQRISNYLDRFSENESTNGWKFFFHQLDEMRIPLTQKVHQKLVDILTEEKGLTPVAFFQNGAVYLYKGNFHFSLEIKNQIIEQVTDYISKKALGGDIKAYIVRGANGIQIKDAVFQGFNFEEIISGVEIVCEGLPTNSIYKLIDNLKGLENQKILYDNNFTISEYENEEVLRKAFLIGGLASFAMQIVKKLPSRERRNFPSKKLEIMLKISFEEPEEKYEELVGKFGILLTNQTKWGQKNVPNMIIAKYTPLSTNQIVKKVSNMFFEPFREVSTTFADEVGLRKYLEKHLSFPQTQSNFMDTALKVFEEYSKDESDTCTICGNAGPLTPMKNEEIPNGFQLQTFSNRLDIHSTSTLTHRVCGTCRTSLMLMGKDLKFGYYVYLYADTYFPVEVVKSLKEYFESESQKLQNPDVRFSITADNMVNFASKGGESSTKLEKIDFFPVLSFPLNVFLVKDNSSIAFMLAFMLGYKLAKMIGAKFSISKNMLLLPTSNESFFNEEEVPAPYKSTVQKCIEDEKYMEILIKVYGFWKKVRQTDKKGGELHVLFSAISNGLDTIYELKKLSSRNEKNNKAHFYKEIGNIADFYIERRDKKMSTIKKMAKIGFDYHLTAKGYSDYAIARAIDAAIKVIRTKRDWASGEDLRALIAYEISRAVMRSNDSSYESRIKEGAQNFAELFWQLIDEDFKGNVLKFVKDWKKVRAVYISYFESMILEKSKKNKENTEEKGGNK